MAVKTIYGKPRMLASIDWQETSGVDHPANLEEGWALMKAITDGGSMGDMTKAIEEEELLVKAQDSMARLLTVSAEAGYFTAAPGDVRKAVDTLTGWFSKEGFGVEGKPEAARKSTRQQFLDLMKRMLGSPAGAAAQDALTAEDEEAQIGASLKAAWPTFSNNITSIAKARVDRAEKAAAVGEAVGLLASATLGLPVQGTLALDRVLKADSGGDKSGKMQTCPDCGAENAANAKYCTDCGASMQAKDKKAG